jgi:hypothetical protein
MVTSSLNIWPLLAFVPLTRGQTFDDDLTIISSPQLAPSYCNIIFIIQMSSLLKLLILTGGVYKNGYVWPQFGSCE